MVLFLRAIYSFQYILLHEIEGYILGWIPSSKTLLSTLKSPSSQLIYDPSHIHDQYIHLYIVFLKIIWMTRSYWDTSQYTTTSQQLWRRLTGLIPVSTSPFNIIFFYMIFRGRVDHLKRHIFTSNINTKMINDANLRYQPIFLLHTTRRSEERCM